VLTRTVGASADLVEGGKNGDVIAPGDVGAAADALVRLARDAQLRMQYGSRSRELVRAWSYGPSVDAFVALASEVAR
jgi:glycosyltransferase involved in cell wall biosynthesis